MSYLFEYNEIRAGIMPKSRNHRKGDITEGVAALYLKSKGYQILERNWRHGRYEVDLIAAYQNELVIVEVKYRNGKHTTDPGSEVSKKQWENLAEAAEAYVEEKDDDRHIRFDLVILTEGEPPSIEHFEAAHSPSDD